MSENTYRPAVYATADAVYIAIRDGEYSVYNSRRTAVGGRRNALPADAVLLASENKLREYFPSIDETNAQWSEKLRWAADVLAAETLRTDGGESRTYDAVDLRNNADQFDADRADEPLVDAMITAYFAAAYPHMPSVTVKPHVQVGMRAALAAIRADEAKS